MSNVTKETQILMMFINKWHKPLVGTLYKRHKFNYSAYLNMANIIL